MSPRLRIRSKPMIFTELWLCSDRRVNHRYEAARKKGMQKLPVVWLDVDDDRALRILLTDNRLNDVAAYDEAALAELRKGMDALTGTGWDEAALAELLGEPEETPSGPADPDAQTDRAAE